MKLSIFYFMAASMLVILFHCNDYKLFTMHAQHCFVCVMAAHFAFRIYIIHKLRKESKQMVKDSIDKMVQEAIKSVNNHFRNN